MPQVAKKPAALACGRFPFCYAFLFLDQNTTVTPSVTQRFLSGDATSPEVSVQ